MDTLLIVKEKRTSVIVMEQYNSCSFLHCSRSEYWTYEWYFKHFFYSRTASSFFMKYLRFYLEKAIFKITHGYCELFIVMLQKCRLLLLLLWYFHVSIWFLRYRFSEKFALRHFPEWYVWTNNHAKQLSYKFDRDHFKLKMEMNEKHF